MFMDAGLIQAIGNGLNHKADHTIDANGITAIPGLIDSHSHPSIGEYTAFPHLAQQMWVRRRRTS